MLPPCMLLRTAGVVVAVPHMALLRMRRRERELQAKAMLVALMVLTAITLVAVAVARALWAMPRPLQNPVTAAQA